MLLCLLLFSGAGGVESRRWVLHHEFLHYSQWFFLSAHCSESRFVELRPSFAETKEQIHIPVEALERERFKIVGPFCFFGEVVASYGQASVDDDNENQEILEPRSSPSTQSGSQRLSSPFFSFMYLMHTLVICHVQASPTLWRRRCQDNDTHTIATMAQGVAWHMIWDIMNGLVVGKLQICSRSHLLLHVYSIYTVAYS